MTESPVKQISNETLLPLRELLMGIAAFSTMQAKVAELEANVKAMKTRAGQGGEGHKKWFNLSEAAERLRCSPKTITRWIKAGRLRRNMGHRRVLIPIEDIEGFSERVTVPLRR